MTDDNRKSSFPARWQEVDAVEGGARRRKESEDRGEKGGETKVVDVG